MRIALLGNPNTGKSTLFNILTGLKQHVGNFPGVTVDKKTGLFSSASGKHEIIDFPGTYSIYPRSKDEEVVYNNLVDENEKKSFDHVIVVLDSSNLERNLLLFTQVYDLNIPTTLVLNMTDLADKRGLEINTTELQTAFPEATIVHTIARIKSGKSRIKEAVDNAKNRNGHRFYDHPHCEISDLKGQEQETEERVQKIKVLTQRVIRLKTVEDTFSNKIDRILTHKVYGYLIFLTVLIALFQFIYVFAGIPMDFIDSTFGELSAWLQTILPEGILNDLITQGIVPGIGGVLIFIPQIAILFFFLAILEETGYLSRVVFIMDRLVRPLGLNGKSVVPLLSSVACAIPGVMATRTISDWKERLITIMVAPLMSCSARIPVYTILIALVIPRETVFGFLNLQGIVLFALYVLGTTSALLTAFVLKKLIRSREKGFLLLEMPSYKVPHWKNVYTTVWSKSKIFVLDAGKIILSISIVLWALASYGPGDRMAEARKTALNYATEQQMSEEESERYVAMNELESSYIGLMGKAIEPTIRPLGYDWKIGIALITSFAAREVFVGSMATIYAVQDNGEQNIPLLQKMRNEKHSDGSPVYSLATGLSLMVFYVFAMMCMATLAVVKRETKSWKWPLIQLGYMGTLAYVGALITYLIFK